MAYNIFQLVLDFQRDPSHFGALIGPDKPLPEDTGKLLEEVASKASLESDDEISSDELFSATVFFVERIFFMPGGSLYRQLGLEQNATQEQIRTHYHLLMSLFLLDREDMAADWSAEYAGGINRAYSILRDPLKRRNYDARLSGQESVANEQAAQSESGKSFARSIVSFATARNKNQVGQRVEDEEGKRVNENLSRNPVAGAIAVPSEDITIHPEAARVTEEDSFIADSIERAYSDIGARAVPVNDEMEPHLNVEGFTSDELNKRGRAGIAPIRVDDDFSQTVEAAYIKRSQDKPSSKTAVILALLLVIIGVMAAVYEYQIAPGALTSVFKSAPEVVTDEAAVTERLQQSTAGPDNVIAGSIDGGIKSPTISEPAEVNLDAPDRSALAQDNIPELIEVPGVESLRQESKESEIVTKPTQQASVSSATADSPQNTSTPLITGLSLSPRRLPKAGEDIPKKLAPAQISVLTRQETKAPVKKPINKTAKPVVIKEKNIEAAVAKSNAEAVSQAKASPPREAKIFSPPEMTPPAVKTPLLEPDADVVSSLTTVPEPVLEVLKPEIHRIPEEDLDNMVRTFIRSYEEGDLKTLLSVFAEDARTNDRTSRDGIAEDYRDLFAVAEKRQFVFDGLNWDRTDENHARGMGAFEVRILLKGESSVSTIKGRVTIDVEKRNQDLFITRFFHSYE